MANVSALPVGLGIQAKLLSTAKKHMELEGKAALTLIESAAQSAPNPAPSADPRKGTNINIRA